MQYIAREVNVVEASRIYEIQDLIRKLIQLQSILILKINNIVINIYQ